MGSELFSNLEYALADLIALRDFLASFVVHDLIPRNLRLNSLRGLEARALVVRRRDDGLWTRESAFFSPRSLLLGGPSLTAFYSCYLGVQVRPLLLARSVLHPSSFATVLSRLTPPFHTSFSFDAYALLPPYFILLQIIRKPTKTSTSRPASLRADEAALASTRNDTQL